MKSFTIFFFISQICVKGILLLSFHSFDTIYYERAGNTISVLAAIPSVLFIFVNCIILSEKVFLGGRNAQEPETVK